MMPVSKEEQTRRRVRLLRVLHEVFADQTFTLDAVMKTLHSDLHDLIAQIAGRSSNPALVKFATGRVLRSLLGKPFGDYALLLPHPDRFRVHHAGSPTTQPARGRDGEPVAGNAATAPTVEQHPKADPAKWFPGCGRAPTKADLAARHIQSEEAIAGPGSDQWFIDACQARNGR